MARFTSCLISSFWWLTSWLAILVAGTFLINYWTMNKSYLFTHQDLEKIAVKYQGKSLESSFDGLVRDLKLRYGPHILDVDKSSFFLMNAGGWMGQVCVLFVTPTEYVLIFSTVQESRGHSGRYWLNITDYIVDGWMEQWKEHSFKAQNFTAGTTVHHPWFTAAGVHFGANSWFIEHGRGFVPSSMFFASADAFFSTHDFLSWYRMIRVFTVGLGQEAFLGISELVTYLAES